MDAAKNTKGTNANTSAKPSKISVVETIDPIAPNNNAPPANARFDDAMYMANCDAATCLEQIRMNVEMIAIAKTWPALTKITMNPPHSVSPHSCGNAAHASTKPAFVNDANAIT